MGLGERVLDWMMEHVVTWLVTLLIVGVVVVLIVAPFAIYADMKAERFSLRKDEWSCSASVERPVTTYIQSGNVMIPITSYTKHCTQWSERP